MFRADSAFGVLPSEPSPRFRFPGVSAGCRPACHCRKPCSGRTEVRPNRGLTARLPGSSWNRVPRGFRGCLARNAAGCSLGLSPFQGSSAIALTDPSAHLLPHACPSNRLPDPKALHHGVSIGNCLAQPRGSSTPLRVLHLNIPGMRLLHRPGLCVHLATRRMLPFDSVPLLGSAPAYRSCQGC